MRLALTNNTCAKNFDISSVSDSVNLRSNTFQTLTNLFKGNLKSVIPCCFTLQKDEVFRVPSACQELQVLSGTAWITIDGNDLILNAGEKAAIASDKDCAIVSALGNSLLTLQILSFVG